MQQLVFDNGLPFNAAHAKNTIRFERYEGRTIICFLRHVNFMEIKDLSKG